MAQKNWSQAIEWFCKVLGATGKSTNNNEELQELLEQTTDVYWEATLFNLGHAYRKLRQFDRAIMCLERCLTLQESASTLSALAFCKHLQGDLDGAIDAYHQSLSRKPDNPFCSEMLQRALSDALEDGMYLGEEPHRDDATTIGAASTPRNSAAQMAVLPSATTPAGDQSSLWTEDGLSISVESHTSDVDMG